MTATRAVVAWRCPVCRSRGTLELPVDVDVQARILEAHATKQPRCDGTPCEVES
jgi:hypothetical protein